MPYDNPTMAGGGDMGGGPPATPDPDQSQESQEKGNTIHIAASDLPEGVEPKAGTKVMFCITGPPDAEGDCPGYFETSDENQETEKGTSWEDDFRKSMSPRAGQDEAGEGAAQ